MRIEESGTTKGAINIMTEATRIAKIMEEAGTIARGIATVPVIREIRLAIAPLTAAMSIATARMEAGQGYLIERVSPINLL